jgi:hypothetical protein
MHQMHPISPRGLPAACVQGTAALMGAEKLLLLCGVTVMQPTIEELLPLFLFASPLT